MQKIVRRGLLAAAGTLLAGVVARKYLLPSPAPQAPQEAPQSGGPATQPVDVLRAQPPVALPALHFTAADGAARSLADYAGRGVVLNFWATWCVPCVSEMPALDALSRALADKGIVVLPVSLDHTGADAVKPFYAGHGIGSLPVLLDMHAETMVALKLEGIPTTLVIDRSGREVARVQGPVRWDSADAASVVGRLVG